MELATLVEGIDDWQGRLVVMIRWGSVKGAKIALVVRNRPSFPIGDLLMAQEGVLADSKAC